MPLSKIARLAAIAASVAVAAPLLGGSAAAQLYYPQVEPYHGPFLPEPATTPAMGRADGPDTATPVHAVFLRAGPSRGSPVIGLLRPGMPLHVLASGNYGWIQVSSPEGTGWTFGSYLAPGAGASAVTQITSP